MTKRIRLITRHHLEVWDGSAWLPVATFAAEELARAKRIALEEANAPDTEDLAAPPATDAPEEGT